MISCRPAEEIRCWLVTEMQQGHPAVAYLTSFLSRSAGGLFDAVRNLALSVDEQKRYAASVMGVYEPEFDRDRLMWGKTDVTAFRVTGPSAFGYAPQLLPGIRQKNPDIVHVHGLWMYPSVAAFRWSAGGRPYMISPHGMLDPWALGNSSWKKRISAALYENRHLRGAACLHALNEAEAESMRAFGLRNPICVIPNGVEMPRGEGLERPHTENNVLLYLGRLHPKKGLPALIEGWSRVQANAVRKGWSLTVAGWDQNGHRSELEELTTKLRVSSSVSFVGPKYGEAKAQCFRTASAFVLPSVSEGLPLSVLEAWSWGLPVLMTAECNLPEGEKAGAAISMNASSEGVATALTQLIEMSSKERNAMGLHGRRLVEDRFRWTDTAQQMTDVYDWILGLRPQPASVLN